MANDDRRARLTVPAVAACVVFSLDAVAALALTVVLAIPTLIAAADEQADLYIVGSSVLQVLLVAVVALVCPAVAALVAGVRTRPARVAGCVTAGLVVAGAAALAALWAPVVGPPVLAGLAVAGLANVAALALLLEGFRPAPAFGERA